MNDTSVHTILAAISEAKLALDREPEYKAQISDLGLKLNAALGHNQELELNAIDYKAAIAQLNDKVRSLEVERDDASFRNLELEDKYASLLKLARDYASKLEGVRYDFFLDLARIDPEPTLEPELPPSAESSTINNLQASVDERASPLPPSTTPSAPTTEAMPASVSSVPEPSSVSDTSTELPYKGRKYSEVFHDKNNGCDLQDWTKRGGEYTDFWR